MRWNRTGLRAWIAVLAVMGLGATLARPGAVAAQPQGTESCRLDPFDLTDDGYISRADADLWQQYFAAGDLRADLNGDGKLERAEGPSILKEMIKPDCKLLAIKAKGQGSIEVGGHYADAASESLYWTKRLPLRRQDPITRPARHCLAGRVRFGGRRGILCSPAT